MGERIILVEGNDDYHFILNVLKTLAEFQGVESKIIPGGRKCRITPQAGEDGDWRMILAQAGSDTRQAGGVNELLREIPEYLKSQETERLIIICDADLSFDSRKMQVMECVANTPGHENKDAFSLTPNGYCDLRIYNRSIRFYPWLMPDNQSRGGMLEDFFIELIRDNDPILLETNKYIQCIDDLPSEVSRFNSCHRAKAKALAWLAVQKSPGKPIGKFISVAHERSSRSGSDDASASLNLETELFQQFKGWLHSAIFDD